MSEKKIIGVIGGGSSAGKKAAITSVITSAAIISATTERAPSQVQGIMDYKCNDDLNIAGYGIDYSSSKKSKTYKPHELRAIKKRRKKNKAAKKSRKRNRN